MTLFQYELPWNILHLNEDDIYLSMGAGYTPDAQMLEALDVLRQEIAERCRPRCMFAVFDAGEAEQHHIKVNDTFFRTGAVITPYLAGADKYVLFVATAGQEFEAFQHEVKASGDIYKEFLLDSLGSAIAEAVVRELCARVENHFLPMGYGVSHPYSPGYCGWHVTQQQLLFSMLPVHPCGVALSESSLMTPIKSVSGVMAVGSHIVKRKYGCELCGKADCYKNRNK